MIQDDAQKHRFGTIYFFVTDQNSQVFKIVAAVFWSILIKVFFDMFMCSSNLE